jgi:hypothetical protein
VADRLSPAEAAFFKTNGYIVKRGLIPAADLAPFVDLFWERCAPPCLDRDQPATWVDPQERAGWGPPPSFGVEIERTTGASLRRDPTPSAPRPELGSIPGVNRPYPAGYRHGSIKWTAIGGDQAFNDATSAHPNVLRMVHALIGGPVKRPHRNRGLYPNFPRSAGHGPSSEGGKGLGPHIDTMPAELLGFTYMTDVHANSGGTTIWPTSPQRLWQCMEIEQSCGWRPDDTFPAVLVLTQQLLLLLLLFILTSI